MKPILLEWDDLPALYTHRESWAFVRGSWMSVDPAEVYRDGRLISEKAFAARFPNLPPLPEEAFQQYRDTSKTSE
jgi:hypothetical protein